MNKLFNRLTLPMKLALIALVPLLFLIYLAIMVQSDKMERLSIMENFKRNVNNTDKMASLVDDLQAERRYSYRYVVSKENQSELVAKRTAVDNGIVTLQEIKNDTRLTDFTEFTFLNRLSQIRSQVDEGNVSAQEVMNYYSNVIFRLNGLSAIYTENVPYLNPVAKDLRAMRSLAEMITRLGISRASVYTALYTEQNSGLIMEQIKDLHDNYKSYEQEFYIKGSDRAIAAYKKVREEGKLKTTLDILDTVVNRGSLDTAFNSELWWDISANGVDELKALQTQQVQHIVDDVDTLYNRESWEKDRNLIILVLLVLLVIAIVAYTLKNISDSLTSLRVAARKLSLGQSDINLNIRTRDVIGSLSDSISEIDRSNQQLAAAADAIGKGNFDVVVQPRSDGDLLGNAVVHMKQDLYRFTSDNAKKMWLQQGISVVNDSTRGEREIVTLAQGALDALVAYLKAEIGVFYVAKTDMLEYVAGYAIPDLEKVPKRIRFGETLLGQAALKKEIIELQNVPDEFIKISSGTAARQPKHLMLMPLVYNDVVEGVIELGTIYSFDEATVQLLEQAANNIAVAVHAAKSRTRLQELLEETQSQSTELQAQHNELENINAELEAQTQKLQTSEEELRVQQEELLHANQEMEENTRALEERNQLIVERNHEIQKKAEELALATKYKSEFLANMSHELRTPLNSILLLSRLLSENNDNNLTGEQIEFAQVIQSSGNGLLNLIDEILDLSKIEAGKMDLEYGMVAVKEIINDMRGLFSAVAKEKNLELDINIHQNVPFSIDTDKMRLEQILKNLLSNALKFTSDGRIALDVIHEGQMIVFKVQDTGIGIPANKHHLVFEAFQQADGSTRRKFGGTGLGLSISRELARLLGGDIFLESEPGKGSTFTVKIPESRDAERIKTPDVVMPAADILDEEDEYQKEEDEKKENEMARYISKVIPADVPDDRAEIKAGDKVILIIEDDTNFAKALLDYTRKQGYKGVVAVRGDEGIELANQFSPSGILLDIMLPIKNGWQVMDEIKANPKLRHIPIHTMSSDELRRESMAKGAINFINKPVAFDQMQSIFSKLENVLSREHKKVLIVEENPKHAKALAYFLENFDVNTEIKHDIKDGISALTGQEVDCVILDMGIPDSNAYEMLEEVKKNPGFENLPIIVFTGKSLSKNEESRIRQYADSIVVKTAHSYKRILDEVSLFLHLVEEQKKPIGETGKYKRLGALKEVLEGKTVLIADDDVRNIYSLTKSLEGMKMNVITAIDGKDALRQLENNPNIDIVLMDMMMPEMDGYESTMLIRKNPRYRSLPVIAVTAKAMAGDREKCINSGASDYITKPVDIDQLLSLLRVWLYDKGF